MVDLVKELWVVLKEKEISPETAAHFIGCTGRQVRRWIDGESTPNFGSRLAIRRGLRRIKKIL
jgi:hypothetical protein